MKPPHVSTTLLLGLLGLSACGPEFEEEAVAEDLEFAETESDPSLAPDELPPDEIEAPSDEQQTVSCSLALPANVSADWNNFQRSSGAFSGITGGNYTIEVDFEGSYGLWWYQVYVNGSYLPYETGDATIGPVYAANGYSLDLDIKASVVAPPGYSYTFDVEVYSSPGHTLICSDTTTMTIPSGCIGVGWWYQNPFPSPWYDNANCVVADLPPGANGFMYEGAWYVTPTNGNQCSIGTYDGANCYIGIAPPNRTGFIYQQKLYYNHH
jgi:hypothetical protein